MENSFFKKYFDFIQSIDGPNKVISIISSDYSPKNIQVLIDKNNEYKQSVDTLIAYLKGMYSLNTLPSADKKNINQNIATIRRKDKSLSNYKLSLDAILNNYSSIVSKRDISFVIVFKMGEVWNIDFTSCLRPDRVDTHANRFSLSPATKNYLVVCSYPYQDSQSISIINTLKQNPSEYGCDIKVVCFEELLDDILECIFKYQHNKKTNSISLASPKNMLSIVNGARGVEIEKLYTEVLNTPKNLELFLTDEVGCDAEQTNQSFLPSQYSLILDKITRDFRINKSQIDKITAIHTGKALEKADIRMTILLNDGTSKTVGISVKSSSDDIVSVHEKHANDFIKYLKITDSNVKNALEQFEVLKAWGKVNRNYYAELSKFFNNPNNANKLVEWAIKGEKTNPLRADYVLLHSYTYNRDETVGHAICLKKSNDYIKEILSDSSAGTFNTHLTWTYKNNIQLKAPFSI